LKYKNSRVITSEKKKAKIFEIPVLFNAEKGKIIVDQIRIINLLRLKNILEKSITQFL